jgi:hypothetical protein
LYIHKASGVENTLVLWMQAREKREQGNVEVFLGDSFLSSLSPLSGMKRYQKGIEFNTPGD